MRVLNSIGCDEMASSVAMNKVPEPEGPNIREKDKFEVAVN